MTDHTQATIDRMSRIGQAAPLPPAPVKFCLAETCWRNPVTHTWHRSFYDAPLSITQLVRDIAELEIEDVSRVLSVEVGLPTADITKEIAEIVLHTAEKPLHPKLHEWLEHHLGVMRMQKHAVEAA